MPNQNLYHVDQATVEQKVSSFCGNVGAALCSYQGRQGQIRDSLEARFDGAARASMSEAMDCETQAIGTAGETLDKLLCLIRNAAKQTGALDQKIAADINQGMELYRWK